MSFIPKKFKYKKYKKGRINQSMNKKAKINFGQLALKAHEAGRLTYRQIESARKCIKKYIKPLGGIVKRKVNLTKPVTSKPISSRMGRGKGRVSYHVCPIREGQILYEIYCLDIQKAKTLLLKAIYKLPLKTKISQKSIA